MLPERPRWRAGRQSVGKMALLVVAGNVSDGGALSKPSERPVSFWRAGDASFLSLLLGLKGDREGERERFGGFDEIGEKKKERETGSRSSSVGE